MELAGSEEAVVLVGTDADLLVMLVARTPPDAKLFLLRPSMAVGDRKQNLLFLHAITGCDIPSALYRQGKEMDISVVSNYDIPGYEVKVFNSET